MIPGVIPGMITGMIPGTTALPDFFAARRDNGEPLVLATVVETIGSTYSKAGTHMLIARDGTVAGLLSGGCAEAELIDRAQHVFDTGRAEIVAFDTRGSDDPVWGIGLGCEGAMRILLTRIVANDYRPLDYVLQCRADHVSGAVACVVASDRGDVALGTYWRAAGDAPPDVQALLDAAMTTQRASIETLHDGHVQIFTAPVALPPRLLILGAGADAIPIVEFAARLGWQVTVADHRPAYAIAERFPGAQRIVLAPARELSRHLELSRFEAAVVMSHHLPTDEQYLRLLAQIRIGYVGLLGPASRRQRLLESIGTDAAALRRCLAGPVGLDIGAQTPEAIALAIVAEIHAYLQGRSGASFSGRLERLPATS